MPVSGSQLLGRLARGQRREQLVQALPGRHAQLLARAPAGLLRPPPAQPVGPPSISSARSPFSSASGKVRPIAMTSPTDFMRVPSRGSAARNFSNAQRGILTTQ